LVHVSLAESTHLLRSLREYLIDHVGLLELLVEILFELLLLLMDLVGIVGVVVVHEHCCQVEQVVLHPVNYVPAVVRELVLVVV